MLGDVLKNPSTWVQGRCRDEWGEDCDYDDPHCVKYDLLGAVYKAYSVNDAKTFVIPRLKEIMARHWPQFSSLQEFNDHYSIAWSDVLTLIVESGL